MVSIESTSAGQVHDALPTRLGMGRAEVLPPRLRIPRGADWTSDDLPTDTGILVGT